MGGGGGGGGQQADFLQVLASTYIMQVLFWSDHPVLVSCMIYRQGR